MKSVQRVLIVGGGIVGLTAGIALRRSGAEVILYERAPEIRAAGASLGLWQNALRAFDAAGVGDAVRGIGRQAEMVFHDPSARLLTTPEFGPEDHSYLLVSRSHLTDLLADTLGRERIRLGCPVTGFVEESDQVTVRLADGSTEAGDLLLGADGVHSTVRAQLVPGAAAQEHAGHVAWRAVLPAAPEGIEGDVLVIGHQRCRGGYLKSPEGGAFWLLAQFQSPPVTGNHREECLQRAGNLDDGGWNSVLTKLITATPEDRILFNQILIVPELDKWVSGRV